MGGGSQLTHINEFRRKRERKTERKNRSKKEDDKRMLHIVDTPVVNDCHEYSVLWRKY